MELKNILGYPPGSMAGESMKKLVPGNKLQNKFEGIITNFMLEQEKDSTERMKEQDLLALNAEGYLVSLTVLSHVMLSAKGGLQILSFVNKQPSLVTMLKAEDHMPAKLVPLLFLDHNFNIQAFNKAISYICGKHTRELDPHKYFKSEKKINIRILYPEIFTYENIAEMLIIGSHFEKFNFEPLKEALLTELIEFSHNLESVHISEQLIKLNDENILTLKLHKFEIETGTNKKKTLIYLLSFLTTAMKQTQNKVINEDNFDEDSENSDDWFKEISNRESVFFDIIADDAASVSGSSGI